MKKTKDKLFHDSYSVKKFKHDLKRQNKKYLSHESDNPTKQSVNYNNINRPQKKPKKKTIDAPIDFSLVAHPDETLLFFDHLFDAINRGVEFINIDMRGVKTMTLEVLLYLISLQRMFKENGHPTSMTVKAPKNPELRYLMAQSGFGKYFKGNVDIPLKEEEIFTIRDGMTNKENGVQDAETCAEAIDFALKFHKNKTMKDPEFRRMYNALAEMMTNTDNHAYSAETFRNWYLFAAKVGNGISYYFFDNGQGVIKTAKKNMIETAIDYTFSLGHRSLMRSVLNGEYRSATGKPYRNKGLPEINAFLTEDQVAFPVILTNRIFCLTQSDECHKSQYDFRGTLFAWIFKDEKGE